MKTDLYQALDRDIDERIGVTTGFTALVGAAPLQVNAGALAAFRARYARIKTFQETCRDLFRRSLDGDEDPEIARTVIGELPEEVGAAYHRALDPLQDQTPVFFRTDEMRSGQLSEIQCCGSGWGLVAQLQHLYSQQPGIFGAPKHFPTPLHVAFKQTLESHLGVPPVVHHLVDNASRPHGVRYFIQRTRDAGLKYFSYDRDLGPADCNFVRAHDFLSLPTHNFFQDRMARCAQGSLSFDLPPSALYDGKIILAWPFWKKTRHAFPDEIRSLFPHTTVIQEDGLDLEGGEHVTLDEFCRIPSRRRTWYIKYAGTDIGINWGSRTVFLASTLTRTRCRELLDRVLADCARGRVWVAQRAVRETEPMEILERNGTVREIETHGKLSGFYGPDGLMAIMGMHRRSHKVHGAADTVITAAH